MNLRTFLTAVILFLALVLALPQGASAEAVGHLTEVHGRVDLLKGGKLPATPVKVGDGVATGDVHRTKSLSRAQITFVDQTTLTISPESRIAIEEYMFDPAKGKRNPLLQLFQGMVLAVVSKIYQTEHPDFVVKTHTAIMGIRGTEVGIRLGPNSSSFLNFQGLTRVNSNFPEVRGHVDLKAMEGTEVARGLPPTLPFELGPEDRKLFMNQLNVVAAVKPQAAVCSAGSPGSSACAPGTAVGTGAGAGAGLGSGSTDSAAGSTGSFTGGLVTVVPVVQISTVTPQPTLQTFSFLQQQFFAAYSTSSTNPYTVDSYSGTGSGTMTAVSSATSISITASFNILATAASGAFSAGSAGSYLFFQTVGSSSTNPVILSGPAGGALSGPMQLSSLVVPEPGINPGANVSPNFVLNGTATLQNNTLTYATTGTFTVPGGAGAITGTTTGTLTETLKK